MGSQHRLTAESAKPIAEVWTHPGIVKVKRYGFDIPDEWTWVAAWRKNPNTLTRAPKRLEEDC